MILSKYKFVLEGLAMSELKFKDKINISKIYSLIFTFIKPGFTDTVEHHKYWEIVFVNQGEISVSAEDEIIELTSGDLIIHPPYQNHKIESFKEEKTKITICAFTESSNLLYKLKSYKITLDPKQKSTMRNIISEIDISSKYVKIDRISTTPILSYDPNINTEREASLRNQCIKNNLEILLASFIRNYYDEKKGKTLNFIAHNPKTTCENIISLMKNNLYNDITLKEICRRSYLGKTSMATIFKKHTGMSVMKYYIYLKIEKAKSLLSDSDKSIGEISSLLNFSSQHYFTRTFKSFEGVSPSIYKQNLKK